jgi:protein-S-isoprenylcysteine O-methyltransferase Ste14
VPKFISSNTPPDHPAEEVKLSPGIARMLLRMEKYILPVVFAWLAWLRFNHLTDQLGAYHAMAHSAMMRSVSYNVFFADMTKNILIFTLLVFTVITLLFNKPPVILPDKLKHVLVPLAGSYYTVLYAWLDHFPPSMRDSLFPPSMQYSAAVAGLVLSIIGYSIAIWAMLHLRRSFALFVSVREVVTGGPYRYMRHPIYTGYLFDAAGLLLASFCIGMFALCAGLALLLVCRARMEEEKLAGADPAYRRYIARTGAFLPRFSI